MMTTDKWRELSGGGDMRLAGSNWSEQIDHQSDWSLLKLHGWYHTLSPERQSARMSKITNDGLTGLAQNAL